LEPEILLVDEILAVGDAEFQRKCLGKMEGIAQGGRTVIFVSHQMNAVRRLCDHCIWMNGGNVQEYASTVEVVSEYEASMSAMSLDSSARAIDTSVPARFLSWEIVEPRGDKGNVLNTNGALAFETVVQTNKEIQNAEHGIALWNRDGQLLWAWAVTKLTLASGLNHLVYTLPGLPLRPGVYQWQVSLYEDGALIDNWFCQPELVITTQSHSHPLDQWTGLLNLSCGFRIQHSE
jgi:lipopolysaccharide transport system ATP-binding protein